MTSLLDQLYQAKLRFIALVSIVGGIALLMLAHWAATYPAAPAWLATLPISEIGSTLFGTGLLAVFFEYIDRKHGDQRAEERIRNAVRQEAPAIRDAVFDSLAFNPDALKNIASPETLDHITAGALGLRLKDQALAADIYTDVHDQVIRAPERWRDLHITVNLTPGTDHTDANHAPLFVATIHREYRVQPSSPTLRFASVSDLGEYRELLHDPTIAGQWYFERVGGLDAASPKAFELVQLTVNGKERPIRRSVHKGSQLYSAHLGTARHSGEITIAYTYRALIQQRGHLLYLDIPRPVKGLHIQLNYGNTGIRYVNTLDLIASAQQPRVTYSPESVPTPSIEIGFDGWVFPRSGVAFVWVLEKEMEKVGNVGRIEKRRIITAE